MFRTQKLVLKTSPKLIGLKFYYLVKSLVLGFPRTFPNFIVIILLSFMNKSSTFIKA